MTEPDSQDLERDVDRDWVNWATVLAAALVAAFQFYQGLGPAWVGETPAIPSLFLAGVLAVGVAVFFTSYWRPALYLLGALAGLYVFVVWVLGGATTAATNLAIAGSAALLAVLSFVNFYREQVAYLGEEPAGSAGGRRP